VREKHQNRVEELVNGLRAEYTWSIDETRLVAQ
jgi:hypothetical protein